MVNGTMEEVNCNSCAEKQMLIYKGYKTKTKEKQCKEGTKDRMGIMKSY